MKKTIRSRALLILPILLVLMSFQFLFLLPNVDASICARVKIEIRQELTLERQAFDAHMRINNGLAGISLDNVNITVNFTDEDGKTVLASSDSGNSSALFYIRVDSMAGINNVTGGTVPGNTSADIHWMIIPAPGASNGLEFGTLYYVGATLTYTVAGEEEEIEVSPDYIFVKPMPELTLDYFLPDEVYGDDVFTPQIEPIVPFYLGVRVYNGGAGTAKSLTIESAQPKIVENDQGLLIGFSLDGTEVNGQEATNSLLADFGDIKPNTSGVARWIMTTSLSGQFVDFDAEFSHADELGGKLTSLINEPINTHFLVHDVLVDLPGRDKIRDFLADDGGTYNVYESESIDTYVNDQSSFSSMNITGYTGTLTATPTAGFMYVKLEVNSGIGQKVIKDVVRSDGKLINGYNAWLSKSRDVNDNWVYYFNLFDVDPVGAYTYTVIFEEPYAGPQPPVLQFIPDKTKVAGEPFSFIVEASDPNGTIPYLSASPVPPGATFVDEGDLMSNGVAIGTFSWEPTAAQTGRYEITFTAFDGLMKDTEKMVIIVHSGADTDGDGMADDWERLYFDGDLSRDGTGDYDGDGVTDLEEYQNETNPKTNELPAALFTASPTAGEAALTVNFINNSTGYNAPLSYEWDFDNDGSVDSTDQHPSYTYAADGTYTVKLTVTDSAGVTDTLTLTNYITVTPLATVGTDPATNIGETTATFNATVNPRGSDANVYFEWGTDANYGNATVSQAAGNGTTDVAVPLDVTGLLPDMTYHYRAVAENISGTVYGNDMSFRTNAAAVGWYDPAWQHRQAITFSSAMVDADMADFPLLVRITGANEIFTKARFDGNDILFTLSNGTIKLDHEIERFDTTPGSEELAAWVRVPGVASLADTTIYMYYGNAIAANQENAEGVWDSDYVMVQHLSETGWWVHYDSTANHYDSSQVNVTQMGQTATAKIGGADQFGTDTYINIPDPGVDSPLDLSGSGSITLSAWVYATGTGEYPGNQAGILSKGPNGGTNGYALRIDGHNCTAYGDYTVMGTRAGNWGGMCGTANDVVPDSWDHVVYVYDAATADHYLYINGVLDRTKNLPASSTETANDLRIGEWLGVSFDGFIDEVRISSTGRSAEWVRTSYNNQNSSAYMTISTEELSPVPLATVVTDPATNIGETTATFNATVNPEGSDASVYFEWGADTTYGNTTTPQATGNGTLDVTVSEDMTVLLPGITYHYRIVAENASGTSYGADESFTTAAGALGWFDPVWQHRQAITVSSTITDADLGDFPLLVRITGADEVFTKARFDGSDILFTLSNGTVKLDHEIERFDTTPGSEELAAWVRVPGISPVTDTTIYMYYGNAAAAGQENIEAVWDSSYVMVQHLNETGGQHLDSTSNNNDSDVVNVTQKGQTATAKIGGADEFGTDTYINIPDPGVDSPLDLSGSGSITLSAWVYATGTGEYPGNQAGIINKLQGGGTGYTLRIDGHNCSNYGDYTAMGSFVGNWSPVCSGATPNNVRQGGQEGWYHVVYVYDSSTYDHYLYINGVKDAEGNWGQLTNADSVNDLRIGEWAGAVSFDGFIDEVRISNTGRSADWIRASYNNQNASGTYIAIAGEELSPVPLATTVTDPATNIGETTATFNATVNPNGVDATVYFEWGADAGYGNTTAPQATENGTMGVAVQEDMTGLLPDITYHYRIVAENASGTSYGSDVSFTTTAGTLGWYDPVWQHRQAITVSSAMADADLADFPLLVRITGASEVFTKARFDGSDILFTLSNGTIRLDHEIERFDTTPGSEELAAWVRVPGIASMTDTKIYMYYGNAAAANQENVEGVWDSDYVMVQHLSETGWWVHYDSTANHYDSSQVNVTQMGQTAMAKIGGADEFGTDTYINIPDPGVDSPLDLSGSGSITLSAWVYATGTGEYPGNQAGIISKLQGGGTGYTLRIDGHNCTAYGDYTATGSFVGNWSPVCGGATPNNVRQGGQEGWYHVVYVYDSSTYDHYLYINGVKDAEGNWGFLSNADSINNLRIGEWGGVSFDGFIDEVRISSTGRSAEWVRASYNNQNSSAYMTIAGEELSPVPLATAVTNPATNIGETTATFNATVNPNGTDTTVYFEWGADTTYGNTTAPQAAGSGTAGVAIFEDMTGLLPDITYHYRIVAENASGTSYGSDGSFTTAAGTLGWFDPAWQYRQQVTVSSTLAASDLGNFPLLMKITDPANEVFNQAQADGDDILFTLSNGTIQLDHEMERFDITPGSEELAAWVRVPGISSVADTTIYMYYGNAIAGNQENIEGVWDSRYVMVQHLNETGGQHMDSTANNYDSSQVNVTQMGQTVTAKIGGADEFGTDNYINIPDPGVDSPLDLSGSGSITLSAWVYATGTGEYPGNQAGILSKGPNGGTNGYALRIDGHNCTAYGDYTVMGTRAGNWDGICGTANNVVPDSWSHVVYVYDSATYDHYLYIDGNLDRTKNFPAGATETASDLRIGDWIGVSFDGFIDEVRISGTGRSADWIRASHANQDTPGSFLTIGAAESNP